MFSTIDPNPQHGHPQQQQQRYLNPTNKTGSSRNKFFTPDGTSLAEVIMTEDELEQIMANFAQDDTAYNKTWTRIVVENILSKVCVLCLYIYIHIYVFICVFVTVCLRKWK
jgi:hypothetical protein